MTKAEKRKFIRDLCGSITKMVLNNVDRMPAEWDGIELRQYIADTFADRAGAMSFRSTIDRDRKRLKEYRNTVLVNNL